MELMVVNTYVVSSKTVYPSLPRQRDLIQVIARTTATDNTAKDVAILLTDETFYLHVRVHHCRRALQSQDFVPELVTKLRQQLGWRGKSLLRGALVDKHNSDGFRNNELYRFLRLDFDTADARDSVCDMLRMCKWDLPRTMIYDAVFTPYDADLPAILQWATTYNVRVGTKFRLTAQQWTQYQRPLTTCSAELHVVAPRWEFDTDAEMTMVPLKGMAFDIETMAEDGADRYADARLPRDGVNVLTAVTFEAQAVRMRVLEKHAFMLRRLEHPMADPECVVHEFDTERDLLLAFGRWVQEQRFHFVTHYNGSRYDWPFLHVRARVLGVEHVYNFLSWNRQQECKPSGHEEIVAEQNDQQQSSTNGAAAKNKSRKRFMSKQTMRWTTPGMFHLDLFDYIVSTAKLKRYTLKFVSSEILKETKNDMEYREIRPLYLAGGEGRTRVVDYCLQDTMLVVKLWEKCKVFLASMAQNNVYLLTPEFANSGRQLSSLSLLTQLANTRNMVLVRDPQSAPLPPNRRNAGPAIWVEPDEELLPEYAQRYGKTHEQIVHEQATSSSVTKREKQYEGGRVVPPKPGFYAQPVATLDFNSLYPTIIRGFNLCYTSLIKHRRFLNLPGVEQESFTLPSGRVIHVAKVKTLLAHKEEELTALRKRYKASMTKHADAKYKWETRAAFVREHSVANVNGLHATSDVTYGTYDYALDVFSDAYEQEVASWFSADYAKKIAAKIDHHEAWYAVYDMLQLKVKLVMNALYGFTAAGKYPLLPDPTLAEFICFMGRTMNEQCCVYAEEYGADVIYGDTDSIMITREFNEPGMTDDQKRRAMWALAEKVMAKVNANVRYPCCIIVEKVFDPYLLISKKHYDGFKYEDLNKPGVRCSRGIETVRTDTPTLVQRLMDEVLDAMMAARSVHVIPDIVKRYIADLLYGRVPIDHLVVYKGMRARFASRTPVQVVCEQLDAHGQPRPYVGDKVPILVRRERFTGEGITERASHPTLVAPTDIDYAYYAEMCLQRPIVNNFEHVLPGVDKLFEGVRLRQEAMGRGYSSDLRQLATKRPREPEADAASGASGNPVKAVRLSAPVSTTTKVSGAKRAAPPMLISGGPSAPAPKRRKPASVAPTSTLAAFARRD